MKQRISKLLVCALMCIVFVQTASAISFNPFKRSGRTRATELFITSNFLEPRLIVELAQHRTKQPILLLSPDRQGNYSLFFMPAGTKPMTESSSNFSDIIDLINPRRVIILGNTDYVPAEFVDLAQKKYPVIVLNNEDWEINAKSLADLLDQPKLVTQFIDYRKRLQAAQEAVRQVD